MSERSLLTRITSVTRAAWWWVSYDVSQMAGKHALNCAEWGVLSLCIPIQILHVLSCSNFSYRNVQNNMGICYPLNSTTKKCVCVCVCVCVFVRRSGWEVGLDSTRIMGKLWQLCRILNITIPFYTWMMIFNIQWCTKHCDTVSRDLNNHNILWFCHWKYDTLFMGCWILMKTLLILLAMTSKQT